MAWYTLHCHHPDLTLFVSKAIFISFLLHPTTVNLILLSVEIVRVTFTHCENSIQLYVMFFSVKQCTLLGSVVLNVIQIE